MSEYYEALSKLEAPERPFNVIPGTPHLPLAPKNTPENYRRIFGDTHYGTMPKYSFPQNFSWNVGLENGKPVSYNGELEFQFDTAFVTCPGDRKSIAIRYFLCNDYPTAISGNVQTTIHAKFRYPNVATEGAWFTNVANRTASAATIMPNVNTSWVYNEGTVEKPVPANLYYIDSNLKLCYNDAILNSSVLESAASSSYPGGLKDICAGLVTNSDASGLFNMNFTMTLRKDAYLEDLSVTFKWDANIQACTGFGETTTVSAKPFGNTDWNVQDDTKTQQTVTISFQAPNFSQIHFIASSISPWTTKGILCEKAQLYPYLNKLFPYNRSQFFKVWFLDSNYRPTLRRTYGALDTELIIDNENTFAIEN